MVNVEQVLIPYITLTLEAIQESSGGSVVDKVDTSSDSDESVESDAGEVDSYSFRSEVVRSLSCSGTDQPTPQPSSRLEDFCLSGSMATNTRILVDALAVLVVATFKVNVRSLTSIRAIVSPRTRLALFIIVVYQHTFSSNYFSPQIFRQFLLIDGTVQRLLSAASLVANDVGVLSLIVKLCVNMDVLKPRKVKGAPKQTASGAHRRSGLCDEGTLLQVLLSPFNGRLFYSPVCSSSASGVGERADEKETTLSEGEDILASIKAIVLGYDKLSDKRKTLQRLLTVSDPGAPMSR
jgi:hypothetical protein